MKLNNISKLRQVASAFLLLGIVSTVIFAQAQTSRAAGSTLEIVAVGSRGDENIRVLIAGQEVESYSPVKSPNFWYTGSSDWGTHTIDLPSTIIASDVRLEFTNDLVDAAGDRNVRIQRIIVDGTSYNTRDPEVESHGSWGNGARCTTGNYGNDNIVCNGYVQYSGGERVGNQPPVANAGTSQRVIDSDGDDKETVQLNGSGSVDPEDDIRSYLWSENGSTIATGVNPTVDLRIGSHDIVLTVIDGDDQEDEDTVNVTVSPASTGEGSVLTIQSVGSTGEENVRVLVNGIVVDEFTATRSPSFYSPSQAWDMHTYSHPTSIAASDVRIEFTNNAFSAAGDRNLRIDSIAIDGIIFETEAPEVQTTGTWSNGARCRPGNHESEYLHCNGYAQYEGEGSGPAPNVAPIAVAGNDQVLNDTDRNGVESVVLNAAGSRDPDGTIVSYEWLQGLQVIATGANPTLELAPGGHEIILRVTDNDGATAEDSVLITVREPGDVIGSVLAVKSIGSTGEENVRILVNDVVIDEFTATRSPSFYSASQPWETHTYNLESRIAASDVRIEFTNNAYSSLGDRNVKFDYIEVDGTVFQTEAPEVIISGTWSNGARCRLGNHRSEILHCNGYIQYVGENESSEGSLIVEDFVTNISTPWGHGFLPSGEMIFTERIGRINIADTNGNVRQISADLSDLRVLSNGGLLGLAVDPDYASNRRFYTCQNKAPSSLVVIAWQMNTAATAATRVGSPFFEEHNDLNHTGCQVGIDSEGYLYASTGDNFEGDAPQDLTNLSGKVLRMDRFTGDGAPDNPFIASSNANTRKVYTYGHRNVQGLAFRPGTSQAWSVEHGSAVDDEINLLESGGNYGWDPVPVIFPVPDPNHPNYDEVNNPMTDLVKFPDAKVAKWSSGDSTIAPGDGDFVVGDNWGALNGTLAVAVLKDSYLAFYTFDASGNYVEHKIPTELNRTHGRLRSVIMGPDGSLYVGTSNSGFGPVDPRVDKIIKITPSGIIQ